MKQAVLILGGNSTIARYTALAFAKRGYPLYLAGRDVFELERQAADIKVRCNVDVKYGSFNAEAYDTHASFLEEVVNLTEGLSGVVLAFGDLGDHKMAIHDFQAAKQIIDRNFVGACSVLTYCANYFAKLEKGFIVGITSVAGDRGRQSNYIYGAAKAGLTTFLQGLRNRLFPAGVHVMTVKPGFVDTAMTFGKPGMFLVASPQNVGEKIVAALEKKRNEIYVPWFWRLIMMIIKSIPEFLFKRLKL